MNYIPLLFAFFLDWVLGDPPNKLHPTAAMGTFIRWFDHHNPFAASEKQLQFLYGILLTISGIGLFSIPCLFLLRFLEPFPAWVIITKALLLKSTFSLNSLFQAGKEVQLLLQKNNIEAARHSVAWHLVSRDTSQLDEGHITSAVIESVAENITDSFIAPLLMFVIGGVPLALAYRFVNTADAMIGYHSEKYEYFGKFTAKLDDVLNWIPARISGLLIIFAAPLAGCDMKNAFETMLKLHRKTTSPNAGWTMSAAAGALHVTLEKSSHYVLAGGPGYPLIGDIARTNRLVLVASIIWLGFCILILMG